MKGSSYLRYALYATAIVSVFCPNATVRGQEKTVENRLIDELQLPFVTNAVATTTDNRLFLNVSHLDGSAGPRVVEWRDGKAKPYPDETWNERASSANVGSRLVLVNSLRIGPDGDLWLVDVGSPAFGEPTLPHGPKLVQVDIARNVVRRVYDLTSLTSAKSFVDDVRFHGRTAYLTDAGDPGLIVLDLGTGVGLRVLEGTSSVTAAKPISAEGQVLRDAKDKPVYVQADQLEVTPDGRWLYYQPACGPLSKIETRWLAPQVVESDRLKHVKQVAVTLSTGGTAIDNAGNIYVSDTNEQRILKISPTGAISTLFHDPRLLWVDAMWIDSQGFLWMPAAQLNRLSIFHQGGVERGVPGACLQVADRCKARKKRPQLGERAEYPRRPITEGAFYAFQTDRRATRTFALIGTTILDCARRINDRASPARRGWRHASESLSPPSDGIIRAAGSDLSRPPDAIKEGIG